MNIIENLLRDLHSRGVVFEPAGDKLRVDPVERVKPDELDVLREHKQEILNMFASGRLRAESCPGDECSEILIAIDGLAYCQQHEMTVRFVERPQ